MRTSTGLLLGAALALSACGDREPQAQPDAPVVAEPAAASAAAGETHGDTGAAHAHGGAGASRPLLSIMQQLGTDMAALTHGLMTDDGALVARSAAAMAEHAPIAPEDLTRISAELGADMAEFERLDAAVHDASVRLHDVAAAGGAAEVLTLLNEVQRGCVACHARFRERLRTNLAR